MANKPDKLQSSRTYAESIDAALSDAFLRRTLDAFAVAFRANREAVFAEVDEAAAIARVAQVRDHAAQHLEDLYREFAQKAEAMGVHVHRAATAEEANERIAAIARENGVSRIIKSKSMTSEEIHLNDALRDHGFTVDETDLGEWIIQLRGEGPSHMVMPAIHLSRGQVADDFSRVTGKEQDRDDVQKLVKVARVQLRPVFAAADMAVTGANFAVAETGAVATVTNEGNARLAVTLPRVHVVLAGLDKLVGRLEDAIDALAVLPRNATAQRMTAYVNWVCGVGPCSVTPDRKKILHIVFLDNGRSEIAKDPLFSQIFRCVRCGACANVCPVYRLVGGHRMGHVYIGAIGLVLTWLFHGKDKARILCQNCVGCEACKHVCAGGIDLPGLISEIRTRLNNESGAPMESLLLSRIMRDRSLFHRLLGFVRFAQKPVTSGGFVRHLPEVLLGRHGYKSLPALAETPFRKLWPTLSTATPSQPRLRVALFAGCAQDFIYPEQLVACVQLLAAHNVQLVFPASQTCCGLPLVMMGQGDTAAEVARQNVVAFEAEDAKNAKNADYIVTLCASCASHMKRHYPPAFSSRLLDFASFVHSVLKLGPDDFTRSSAKVAYHASCHLCRGLGVTEAPRALINAAAHYVPSAEEDVCCGFGGTYSAKFPQISAQLLQTKLRHIAETGATHVVVDCPGCVMQLRGGARHAEMGVVVQHLSELLAGGPAPCTPAGALKAPDPAGRQQPYP